MKARDMVDDKWLNNPWNRCDECGEHSLFLAVFNEPGEQEDPTYEVCAKCLRKAIGLIDEAELRRSLHRG